MATVNATFQWICDRDGRTSAVMAGSADADAVIPAGWQTGLGLAAPLLPCKTIDDLCDVCSALPPDQWITPP